MIFFLKMQNLIPSLLLETIREANVCLAISYNFHAIFQLFGTVFDPYAYLQPFSLVVDLLHS